MSFQQMLDKHRSLAFSERDKGSRFERLMQAYLRTDPQFHLQQVWLWSEFPHRLWISTTNRWGANAEETLRGQSPEVGRISLHDLMTAPVDWEKLESGAAG